MEYFNKREQLALTQIVKNADSDTYVLANIFNEALNGTGYSFDLQTGDLITSTQVAGVHDILSVQKKLIEIALLVKFLEDNHYIYLISDASSTGTIDKLGTIPNGTLIAQKMPDDIKQLINKTISRVYVSQNLIELVKNGFMTYETSQMVISMEQLKVSTKALDEAIKQSKFSDQLVKEAKAQTDYIANQVDQLKDQTNVLKDQLNEIKKQTDSTQQIAQDTQKQSNDIGKQLREIKEQTKLLEKQSNASQEQAKQAVASLNQAQKQTDSAAESLDQARAQTRNSYWAIGIAFISVIISIVLPIIMNQCTSQKVVWEPITEYLDSSLVVRGDTIIDKLQHGNVLLDNSIDATEKVSKTIKTKKCK